MQVLYSLYVSLKCDNSENSLIFKNEEEMEYKYLEKLHK